MARLDALLALVAAILPACVECRRLVRHDESRQPGSLAEASANASSWMQSHALLGIAHAFVQSEVHEDERKALRAHPFVAEFEAQGVPLERIFGWHLLKEYAADESRRSTSSLEEQAADTESDNAADPDDGWFGGLHDGFAEFNAALEALDKGQSGVLPEELKPIAEEAQAAFLDLNYLNVTELKAIMDAYQSVANVKDPPKRREPFSKTDPTGYRDMLKRLPVTPPEWLTLSPAMQEHHEEMKVIYERVFTLNYQLQTWIEYVQSKETLSLEELETKGFARRIIHQVGGTVRNYARAFKTIGARSKKMMKNLWVRFRRSMSKSEEKCAAAEHAEEGAAVKKYDVAGRYTLEEDEENEEGDDDNEALGAQFGEQLDRADMALGDMSAGAEEAENAVEGKLQTAKADGERLEENARSGDPNALASAADQAEKSMEGAQDAICSRGRKKSAGNFRDGLRRLKELADDMLPRIGVRGMGGFGSIWNGGLEEVVDFGSKEVAYFTGNGIAIGRPTLGVSVTGYTGVGWKGIKEDWSLDQAYNTELWLMARSTTSATLGALPIHATWSVGVGTKMSADDSAGIPWIAEENAMKFLLFGMTLGAGLGAGTNGVTIENGMDKYRYVTSECFHDLKPFVKHIWKTWCSRCKGTEAAYVTGIRTPVHAASYPTLSEVAFSYLAWRNHARTQRKPERERCSFLNIDNRRNASNLASRAGFYLNEIPKQLKLIKFHMDLMSTNMDDLAALDPKLEERPKAHEIFKHLEQSSCSRFPFEGQWGPRLFQPRNESDEKPLYTREELVAMEREDLQDVCRTYGFPCKGRFVFAARGKEKVVDALMKAQAMGHASLGNGLGTCERSSQCVLKNSKCDKHCADDSIGEHCEKRCQCKEGYCYRLDPATGAPVCTKLVGKTIDQAFAGLEGFVERTKLEVGALVLRLKELAGMR